MAPDFSTATRRPGASQLHLPHPGGNDCQPGMLHPNYRSTIRPKQTLSGTQCEKKFTFPSTLSGGCQRKSSLETRGTNQKVRRLRPGNGVPMEEEQRKSPGIPSTCLCSRPGNHWPRHTCRTEASGEGSMQSTQSPQRAQCSRHVENAECGKQSQRIKQSGTPRKSYSEKVM